MSPIPGITMGPMDKVAELAEEIAGYAGRVLLRRPSPLGIDEPLFTSGLVNSFGLLRILGRIEESSGARIEGYEVNDLKLDTARRLAEAALGRID